MNEDTKGFKDLAAWQRSMDLVKHIYVATRTWPSDERFGLIAQVRRAAVSVPSNIAEGHARTGPREYLHHISIAFGSLAEVETQILIAADLDYLSPEAAQVLLDRIVDARRPLSGLLRSLRATSGISTSPPHRPSPSPPR